MSTKKRGLYFETNPYDTVKFFFLFNPSQKSLQLEYYHSCAESYENRDLKKKKNHTEQEHAIRHLNLEAFSKHFTNQHTLPSCR